MGMLTGKVAIVTGAASGFGRATVRTFAAEGARVIAADMNADGAAAVAAEIGEQVLPFGVDVTRAADVEQMVAFAESSFSGVDILVNNAGITSRVGAIEDVEEDDFDRVVAVNIKGVFLGVKYGVPALRRRGGGVILNTASVGAIRPRANAGIYYPTKAAVMNLTQALAVELGPNIRVNAIAPSLAPTGLVTGAQGGDVQRAAAIIEAGLPANGIAMGRICDPQDVANAYTFLASDKAAYLTGVVLPVDGGLSAGIA